MSDGNSGPHLVIDERSKLVDVKLTGMRIHVARGARALSAVRCVFVNCEMTQDEGVTVDPFKGCIFDGSPRPVIGEPVDAEFIPKGFIS